MDQANIQARIKKIMQMDEEVGKLASATPVMICMSSLLPLGDLQPPRTTRSFRYAVVGFASKTSRNNWIEKKADG